MRVNFKLCQQSTHFLIQNLLCFPLRCFCIQLQTTHNLPMCFPWYVYTLLVQPVYCHWHFAHSILRLNLERSKVSHQGHAHCLVPESLKYQSQGTFSTLWPSKDSPDWQMFTMSALKGLILQNSSFVPTISLTTLYFH